MHVEYESSIAPTELEIDTGFAHFKYFVPPGLKIHDLHRNCSSDRSEIFEAMLQSKKSSPVRGDI
jgi:hypothetical protein